MLSKYGELVRLVAERIERGDYRPGEAVPSLRTLQQQYGISLNTARRAYYELERLGYIEARPRSGYVVTAGGRTADQSGEAASLASPFPHPSLYDTRALSHAFVGAMRHYHDALVDPAPAGLPALRRQLARLAAQEGWEMHADEMLITCGGMEALSLAIGAVTHGAASPQVAVLLPAFPGLLGRLAEQGIRMLPLEVGTDGRLDTTRLEAALAAGQLQAIALMPVHAHPHGRSLPSAVTQQLLALSERYDVPLIEDDAYRWLGFSGDIPSPLKAQDRAGRILLCGTFSKSLSPGYRVGWLLPGRYAAIAARLKTSHTLASPLPNQLALAELLAGNRYRPALARLTAGLGQRVRRLEADLAEVGLPVPQTAEGGCFIWLPGLPAPVTQLATGSGHPALHFTPGNACHPGLAGAHALRLNASFYQPAQQRPALDALALRLRRLA